LVLSDHFPRRTLWYNNLVLSAGNEMLKYLDSIPPILRGEITLKVTITGFADYQKLSRSFSVVPEDISLQVGVKKTKDENSNSRRDSIFPIKKINTNLDLAKLRAFSLYYSINEKLQNIGFKSVNISRKGCVQKKEGKSKSELRQEAQKYIGATIVVEFNTLELDKKIDSLQKSISSERELELMQNRLKNYEKVLSRLDELKRKNMASYEKAFKTK